MSFLTTRRKVFHLVGEAGTNSDGVNRQDELLRSEPGETVELRREPDNEDDPNAILVLSARGVAVGNVEPKSAVALAPIIDSGRRFDARLHSLRGGLPRYPNYGARISLAWDGWRGVAPVPLDEAQRAERRRRLEDREAGWPGRLASRLSLLGRSLPGV
jgi:hypothetical protein